MSSLVGLAAHIMPVELITLLAEKRIHPNRSVPWINEVDIYQFDPSDLPALSQTNSENQLWYFFVELYYKSAKSQLTHRKTRGGNWKITGQRRYVKDKGKVIGSKKTLVFCRRGRTSEEIETDWAMHEFYVKDSPRFEKNLVLCYIGKKRRNKSSVSTPDGGQPNLGLSSDYVTHVTENPSSEVESQRQQPMSQHMITDYWRHNSENSFLQVRANMPYQEEPPPPSSNNLVSEPINPFSEFSSQVGHQLQQTTNMVTVPRSLIPESTTSVVEPQLLSGDGFVPEQMNHIPEITCLMQVIPQLQAEFDATNSSNWLNHSSIPALQMPINPDHYQGFNSSQCSTGFEFPESTTSVVEPQLLFGHCFVPEQMNHIPEITCLMQVIPQLQAEFDATNSSNWLNHSSIPALQMPINPDHYQGFNSSQYSTGFEFPKSTTSVENSFLQVRTNMPYQEEPPPPSSNNSVSEPINPFSEFSSEVGPQLLSSSKLDYDLRNHSIASSSSMICQQPLAHFEEISDYNGLNQSLYPALQSPNNPHQGFNFSYSNGISNNCNMGSYQFTGGLEDVVNSQRNVRN